jgi:hypothetical protein
MIAQGSVARQIVRLKVEGLNRCLKDWAHEQIANTFAVRTFLIPVVAGCFTVRTFGPIKLFGGNCVNAIAAMLVAGFATTTVCDPDVVASAATLGTAGDRQFSFHRHRLMIRACGYIRLFYSGRRPDTGRVTNLL